MGQTAAASASGLDQSGASISVGSVVWSSASPSLATVNATGVVTGVAPGQASIVATSGSRTGQQYITVTPMPVTSVTVAPTTATLAILATQQLTAATLDANGNSLTGRVVTWATSDATKATVNTSGLVTAVAAGTATITATSETKTGTSTITVSPPPVASVTVTPAAATLGVGSTQQLTATTLDANGNTLSGRAVTWATSDATKATVNASGLVTAVAAGTATITATSETKTGISTITVSPPPVASVTVTPAATTLGVGTTQQLAAILKDANGNVLTGQSIAWSTSDATKATVSQSGLVTAVAVGSATIIATSGGKTGTAAITVAVIPVASVTVAPATGALVVGGTLTLTATAFDANGNALPGQTWSWTTTNSSIVSGTFIGNVLTATGVGVGTATITATTGGKSGTSVLTVTSGATSVSLSAAGQSAVFLNSPNFAAALTVQPGSQYLIAVVNTDPTYTSLEDFTLSTTFGAVSSSNVLSGPVKTTMPSIAVRPQIAGPRVALPGGLQREIALGQQAERNHMAVLEQNRRIFARYGSPAAAWARARSQGGRTAQISASVTQTIGAVNKVYVNKGTGDCAAVDSIGARVVAVGQHVIVLADTDGTAWPQAYRPDSSFYQTFANQYDAITYPHLLNYIGNPLAYDANLSGVGKVAVTITPKVNNFGGLGGGFFVAAFVISCDFYPLMPTAPNTLFSNQTEMMYSMVPSASSISVGGWEARLGATAAHESKHIVSIADRILLGPGGTDESWLEEGLAQISSEIWERHFNQATWKGNANFLQTVACEYSLGAAAPCDAANNLPFALMGGHLPDLFQYLQAESTSNAEGFGLDVQSKYGAGWAFARWVIDHYAPPGAEGAFIQSLINTITTGLTTLSTKSGQSVPLLLTYWNVASAVFQSPTYTAADVRMTIPSFNFADIFKVGQTGLPGYSGWLCGGTPCGIFTTSALPVFPVQPIAFSSGTFSRTVYAVPGTSASFFLLSGTTTGIETLYLLSGSGSVLSGSSGFRVAILRVQ